jgi:RNA-binding protein 39
MEFDAYECLEKTVEENDNRDSKRKSKSKEGTKRSYRKRDVDKDDPTLADGDDHKSKRTTEPKHSTHRTTESEPIAFLRQPRTTESELPNNGEKKKKKRKRIRKGGGGAYERQRETPFHLLSSMRNNKIRIDW